MSGRDVAITSGQQLLLPESTRKLRKERRVTIAVNSRDRNMTANYNSNQFRFRLRRPLKDILSIELVNGCIPADLYNVNTGWNIFTFQEGTTTWQVTLTPGQYTAAELAAQLATRLNALSGVANTYTAQYSSITKKLTVTATGPASYAFLFATGTPTDELVPDTGVLQAINTPARLLGFESFDYAAGAGTALTAPNRMDPDLFLQRAYLYINVDSGIALNRVEMGAGRHDCFHILYLDQQREGYYYFNRDTYTPVFYSFPAPISRISVLDIEIRDEFYRLVDLGQHDFTLLFEVTYLD